jgi:hypothetical protein
VRIFDVAFELESLSSLGSEVAADRKDSRNTAQSEAERDEAGAED